MKTMKKILKSLPFQLLLGVIIGIVLGLISNEAVMNVIVTIKFVLGELINFCVPLIVIGFIAPSITKLGKNASRILGVAVLLAYVSSVLAALGSMAAGYGLIPHLSIVSEVDGLKELPEIVFQLEIPQIMSVMSALAFSILIGLAATWTKAETVIRLLDEFQQIVLMIVSKIVIPILPVFIALTFWSLAYEGTITKQLPVFLKVVLIVMVGHFIWMAVLYAVGGIYSGNNPWKVVKHYGPAYITAVGTMSSAATLAVALKCARKSEPVLRDDMVRSQKILLSEQNHKHSSLWFCSDRSIFCDDGLPNFIWKTAVSRNHDLILCTAWRVCNRSTGGSRRNGDGFSWAYHGSSWI